MLMPLMLESGFAGANWNPEEGGFQKLEFIPAGEISGEKTPASWLIDEEYAADWREFQETGKLE